MPNSFTNADFSLDSNYSALNPFVRVKFGANTPLTNTDINEAQTIQEEALLDFIRDHVYSGFMMTMLPSFMGQNIALQPDNLTNAFAFGPGEVFVNGLRLQLLGTTTLQGVEGYNLVQLDAPPTTGYRTDLVFLEVWLQEYSQNTSADAYGMVDGTPLIPNPMLSPQLNDQVSNRVGIQWQLRVADGVDFDSWPMGLGYTSPTSFSPVYAAGAANVVTTNSDYLYMPASNMVFANESFYQDMGLFVAGRPTNTTINQDLGVYGQYVYALPLFRVFRRNSNPYSATSNPYGADVWAIPTGQQTAPPSSRYDGLYANIVDITDIIDLRHTVMLNDYNFNKLHDDALRDVVTGSLQTAAKTVMHRAQFGVVPFSVADNMSLGPVFYTGFNNNYVGTSYNPNYSEFMPTTGVVTGTPSGLVADFVPSVNGFGAVFNGTYSVTFDALNLNFQQGTVDFFMQPYWEGSNPAISQTLITITDSNNNPFLTLVKLQGNLVLTAYQTTFNTLATSAVLPLSQYSIEAGRFHHLRVTWSVASNQLGIFLNGNLVATGPYTGSQVVPTNLIVGRVVILNAPTLALAPSVQVTAQNSFLNVGTYYLTYTYVTSTGETTGAPIAAVVLNTQYDGLEAVLPSTLPAGVSALNVYVGTSPTALSLSTTVAAASALGATVTITALPPVEAVALPTVNTASLPPDTLTPANLGTVIDELVAYSMALVYPSQISPQVPLDFSEGLATIYPSFNGLMRDFVDNTYEQPLLTTVISGTTGSSFTMQNPLPNATFTANPALMVVYTLGTYGLIPQSSGSYSYTGTDSGDVLVGSWQGLGTQAVTFTLVSGTLPSEGVQLQYALDIDGGHGLLDLPQQMLYASLTSSTSTAQEASFNLYNTATPRYVRLINPSTVSVPYNGQSFSETDYAYDYATASHTTGDAYARVLYHYVLSTQSISVMLADNYYGYNVLGVIAVNSYSDDTLTATSPLQSVTYSPPTYDSNGNMLTAGYYNVLFQQAPAPSVILEFVLAMGGVLFDYNPYNKSVVSNIMQANMVTYYAQGTGESLVFPVATVPNSGAPDGCTISYLQWSSSMNPTLVPTGIDPTTLYTAYVNGVAMPITLDLKTLGTPFIGISFLNNANSTPFIPGAGTRIDIPLLYTYQPNDDVILYAWYNKLPYQGTMGTQTYTLTRVSDWYTFITTLSSGNTYLASENVNVIQLPLNSVYNAVNRLPGGKSMAHIIEGSPIVIASLPSGSQTVNNQFVMLTPHLDLVLQPYNLDDALLNLEKTLTVSKVEGNYQDAVTNLPFSLLGFVLPDTVNPIHKYVGASCLALDSASQELVLFVLGSLQDLNAQSASVAQADYCDIYYINGRPLVLSM